MRKFLYGLTFIATALISLALFLVMAVLVAVALICKFAVDRLGDTIEFLMVVTDSFFPQKALPVSTNNTNNDA